MKGKSFLTLFVMIGMTGSSFAVSVRSMPSTSGALTTHQALQTTRSDVSVRSDVDMHSAKCNICC